MNGDTNVGENISSLVWARAKRETDAIERQIREEAIDGLAVACGKNLLDLKGRELRQVVNEIAQFKIIIAVTSDDFRAAQRTKTLSLGRALSNEETLELLNNTQPDAFVVRVK